MKKELRALISLNLCFAMLLSLLSPMAAFAVDKKSTTSYAFVLESTMVEMNLAVGEVLEVKAIDTDGCLVVYTVHDTTLFDGYGHDGKCINTWLKIEDGMVTGIAENQMVVTDCGEISSTSCILYNGEVTATCGEETIFVNVTAEDCEAEGCATGEEIDSVDACGVGTRPCSVDVTGNVYALYDENKQVICALAAGALEEVSLVKTWYVGAEDETDAEAKLYSDGRMEITGKGAIKSFSHSGYDVTALFVGDGITNIPDYLLDNKKTLQFVKLGQNVQTVGYDAFGDCSNLTEVVFNEGLKRIEGYAFANTAIRHFATGDVTQIDYRAFANCSELQSVTVHGDLQSLGSDAFRNCVKLRNVSWKNDQCLNMSTGAFYNAGSEGAGITLTAYGSIPASLFYVSGNDIGENGEGHWRLPLWPQAQ